MNVRTSLTALWSLVISLLLPCVLWAQQPNYAYNKSWVFVDVSNGGKPLVSGDTWEVPVEYYLDPTDHAGKTRLALWGAGPWIDTPDGKYVKERGHISYPGLFDSFEITQPGPGRHLFRFTVPPDLDLVRKNNRILFIATFRDAAGQEWPWQHRVETSFVRRRGFFEIETDVPGNLFTYAEPVRLRLRLKNVRKPGETKTLRYVVHDTRGGVVAEGQKSFTVETEGQQVDIDLKISRRGVFLIEVDVPGWESRRTTFARIPDLASITRGRPTPFGMTFSSDSAPEEVWAIAQRLGLSACRRFIPWYRLEPGPGVYKLDALAQELDAAGRHGVREWLCIGDPPPFAFAGKAAEVSYRAFDFRENVWRDFVRTVTARLKGKLLGWEWLNEITPGGGEDPVTTYTQMCRLGAETAKAVDPHLLSIMAGGLWPRAFRNAVLAAGIGKYVDVLPVHYQNGGGVREAREDLDAVGRPKVAVWDDESARGRNAWAVPPLEEMENTEQCNWVLRQWPDELAAGCRKLTYFGGEGDAAGSWDYLLDDLSPRPVAATLAVLTSKLAGAAPLGDFQEGQGGVFHLFERDGRPVLVASIDPQAGAGPVALRVGSERVILTDYQGNETVLRAQGGVVDLPRASLLYFVEGVDLDTVKADVVPEIAVAHVGGGSEAGVMGVAPLAPRVALVRGVASRLVVRLHNPYAWRLSGALKLQVPQGWPAAPPIAFALGPGQEQVREVAVRIPGDAATSDYPVKVAVTFAERRLPRVEKPVVLSVISEDMLGNLMPNGGFETPNAAGTGPEDFSLSGTHWTWAPAEGLHEGLGSRVLKFQNSSGWEGCSQTIPVRGGQTYLYTAWVRNQNMDAGSNMTLHLAGGRDIQMYDMSVMYCGQNNPFWQVYTCRKAVPPDTQTVTFSPLANGPGWTTFDNIRVTLYQGSDYAAEAHHTKAPPKLDGSLDGWIKLCPIPLIGRNQLTYQAPGYVWTPDNLSAVGYLMWDDANLYVALSVRDDKHYPATATEPSGDAILQDDSVVLAIDPTMRGPDARQRSFAYYLSAAAPGSGSGKYTLFRPPAHSGGRPSGHLLRDSSIYDMTVVPSAGACLYELRIPLSELGIQGVAGTRIGLSLQLNDNDGTGLAAQMNWGGGLYPTWNPLDFGIVTLVD
jgi:hypothetical protein